ncbi:MAG: hypothetical protein II629_09015 [Ruminococcus sp.]|nr:hypothetical protein [Ruminococcus sp.]
MVDIKKLIAWLDASSQASYCLYEDYKAHGKELEAMRYITEMCCKHTFRDLLTNEDFLNEMYHVYFPEEETGAN